MIKGGIRKFLSIMMCFVFIITSMPFSFESKAVETSTRYVYPNLIYNSPDSLSTKRVLVSLDIYPDATNYQIVNAISSQSRFEFWFNNAGTFEVDKSMLVANSEISIVGLDSTSTVFQPKHITIPIDMNANTAVGSRILKIFSNNTDITPIYEIASAFYIVNNNYHNYNDFFINTISSTSVTLGWQNDLLTEQSDLERTNDLNSSFTKINTVPISQDLKSYTDNTVQPGLTYYYQLKHSESGGTEVGSSILRVQTPTKLVPNGYVDVLSGNTNVLEWDASSNYTVTYKVYKQTAGYTDGTGDQLIHSGPEITYTDDKGIQNKIIKYKLTTVTPTPTATVTPTPTATVTPTPISQPSSGSGSSGSVVSTPTPAPATNTDLSSLEKQIDTIVQGVTNTEENKKALIEEANIIAQTSINSAGIQKIEPKIEKGVAKVEITSDEIQQLEAKADKVIDTVNRAVQSFDTHGVEINQKFEKKVALDIQASDLDEIKTIIPASIFERLEKKGINKLEIGANVAKVALDTKALVLENNEKVELNISKIQESDKPTVKLGILDAKNSIYKFDLSVISSSGMTRKITNFEKDIRLTIPYQIKKDENPDSLSVYLFVEDATHLENPSDTSKLNTWQAVGGKYDPTSKSIVVNRKTFSMYTIMNLNRSFDDITNCEWARKEIEMMASKGVVNGKAQSKFRPTENVTRAEFTAFLVRTLGLLDKKAEVNFSDINKKDWYYEAIASAFDLGIVSGKGDNKFLPNEYITRQEMMLMASNAAEKVIGINPPKDNNIQVALNGYKDKDNVAAWAKKAVGFAIVKGIIKGEQNSRLNPNQHATRAETVVMLKRIYDII